MNNNIDMHRRPAQHNLERERAAWTEEIEVLEILISVTTFPEALAVIEESALNSGRRKQPILNK